MIWKTPDQKPNGEDTYIAITNDGLICSFVSPKMCDDTVARWCYTTDLIAQVDKAERLQKAVDYALQVLDNVSEIGGIDLETAKIKQLIKE